MQKEDITPFLWSFGCSTCRGLCPGRCPSGSHGCSRDTEACLGTECNIKLLLSFEQPGLSKKGKRLWGARIEKSLKNSRVVMVHKR